jgi:hypothetical protein
LSLTHSPNLHSSLIARIPVVTGRSLAEWFHRLESGPAFLRREERAHWLADEAGISCGYAYAIVHEYEMRRRLQCWPRGDDPPGTPRCPTSARPGR